MDQRRAHSDPGGAGGQALAGETDAPGQVLEPGIGTHAVKQRIGGEVDEPGIALTIGELQPQQGSFWLTEPHVRQRPCVQFDFRIIALDGRADLAALRGAYHITFAPPGATRAISDSGKELVVLRKQADGSWLRVGDIWNSDLPARK